jgi:hypothetical protein
VSYAQTWFLWEGESGVAAWSRLLAMDSNPFLFRCYFHDSASRVALLGPETSLFRWGGPALAVRKDGSVSLDRRRLDQLAPTDPTGDVTDVKPEIWALATEVPCPTDICDGKHPEEGVRQ